MREVDGELLRRASAIERFFGPAGFLASSDWEPHPQEIVSAERGAAVYGSRFPLGEHEAVYLLVNPTSRSDFATIELNRGTGDDFRWWDCHSGQHDGSGVAHVEVEGGGLGCVYVCDAGRHASSPRPGLPAFLARMRNMTHLPLSSFSHEWKYLLQEMVPSPHVRHIRTRAQNLLLLVADGAI